MPRLVTTAQNKEYFDWIGDQLGEKYDPKMCTIITHLDKDGILAVTLFNNFMHKNCEMTIATSSSRWCTREYLRICFGYAFLQCDLARITFVVELTNDKCLTLCRKLGAVKEGYLKDWFGKGKSGFIFGIYQDECRWIKI